MVVTVDFYTLIKSYCIRNVRYFWEMLPNRKIVWSESSDWFLRMIAYIICNNIERSKIANEFPELVVLWRATAQDMVY